MHKSFFRNRIGALSKKALFGVGLGFLIIIIILAHAGTSPVDTNQPTQVSQLNNNVTPAQVNTGILTGDTVNQTKVAQPVVNTVLNVNTQKAVPLEKPTYYKNTYGNTVQSPTHYNSVPAGASALCGDGTYSFSQSRRGTCSHHGGVAEWL